MSRADVSMTPEEELAFLEEPHVGTLATLASNGWPHLTGMWYVPVLEAGLSTDRLRMWTYAKSQKALNARRDARASFLIEDGVGYDELRGVSIRGTIELIEDFEQVRAIGIALYGRYTKPRLGIPIEDGPIVELERQARKRVGLSLSMDDVASWDHSKLS